ncbi:MAG: hypothetical protein QOC81_4060 [Thermoanaerobaculia bacterium]|jgi:hypothetical protein|nr:hypothetical protein [Thermoanaerobaculia bacterium]
MSATLLYRIASVVLILFAAGHTAGFLSLTPPTPQGVAVRDAMNDVHFPVGSGSYTYGGFYKGFGLTLTAYMLFSALLAWHLGGLAATRPDAIGILGWAFFALQIASLVLSWMYFFPVPVVFSGVVAVCVGWAAWLVK